MSEWKMVVWPGVPLLLAHNMNEAYEKTPGINKVGIVESAAVFRTIETNKRYVVYQTKTMRVFRPTEDA
ncbi:hypothetical protein LCGC14_0387130 [marine sediment metagenome]|uniref:Uncharacterized protein n=1 Tax=marine sediment metagenome TaxID=412755 RepID=A0A0F9T0S2_9ZZZZ